MGHYGLEGNNCCQTRQRKAVHWENLIFHYSQFKVYNKKETKILIFLHFKCLFFFFFYFVFQLPSATANFLLYRLRWWQIVKNKRGCHWNPWRWKGFLWYAVTHTPCSTKKHCGVMPPKSLRLSIPAARGARRQVRLNNAWEAIGFFGNLHLFSLLTHPRPWCSDPIWNRRKGWCYTQLLHCCCLPKTWTVCAFLVH